MEFNDRITKVIEYTELTPAEFSEEIGVQRSSMSHLLSGRNKPSLDFVMKIMEVFPDVDLYWILNGKGSFPKNNDEEKVSKINTVAEIQKDVSPISSNENFEAGDLFSSVHHKEQEKTSIGNFQEPKNSNLGFNENEIDKIVFFYKNGTFKVYVP